MNLLYDSLIRIKNAQFAGLQYITLQFPISFNVLRILDILYRQGYIRGYQIGNMSWIGNCLQCFVFLKYDNFGIGIIQNIGFISRPGKRCFFSYKNLWKVNFGFGLYIFSTKYGLMSSNELLGIKEGGEMICFII